MLALRPHEFVEMRDGIVIQAVTSSEQYYAFDVATGDHYRLNETAHWILGNIGKGIMYADLKARFVERFEVDQDVAEDDLSEFLAFGFENRLVKRR